MLNTNVLVHHWGDAVLIINHSHCSSQFGFNSNYCCSQEASRRSIEPLNQSQVLYLPNISK